MLSFVGWRPRHVKWESGRTGVRGGRSGKIIRHCTARASMIADAGERNMPSPFPGMDPFLEDERLWPEFQHHLVMSLYHLLLPSLADRYRARIGQRQYITEQALFTSIVREEHNEEYIETRQRSDGKLVTIVEVVSPSNK